MPNVIVTVLKFQAKWMSGGKNEAFEIHYQKFIVRYHFVTTFGTIKKNDCYVIVRESVSWRTTTESHLARVSFQVEIITSNFRNNNVIGRLTEDVEDLP